MNETTKITTITITPPTVARIHVWHSDPGHAWLQVTLSQLADVGLGPLSFSVYSYSRNGVCYLEEDCDAPKYLDAYRLVMGEAPKTRERYYDNDAPIRGYGCIYNSEG